MARKYVELHMHAWLIFVVRHIVAIQLKNMGSISIFLMDYFNIRLNKCWERNVETN